MDNKLVVFDTRHAERTLLDFFTQVYSQQPLLGLAHPNKIQILNLIHAMFSQIFEMRDRGVVGANETDWDVIYTSLLYGVEPGRVLHRQVKNVTALMDHTVVIDMWELLRHQVDAHSTLSSFIKWDVINSGSVILAIEKGDQRILQWREQVNAKGEQYHRLDLTQIFDDFKKEFEKTYGPYPVSQLDAILIKSVLDLFPQIKLRNKIEQVNYDIAVAYGIVDLHIWIDAYMKQVLEAYRVPAFGVYIPHGPAYDAEYINNVLSVRKINEDELVEETDSDKELAISLMRGDYLPREERERAERYILDNQM